jgi:hypothetical protein
MEHTVTRQIFAVAFALATAVCGCHKDNSQDPANANDLNLANQPNSTSLDSVSAAERGYAAPSGSRARVGTERAPAATEPVRHTHRASSEGTYDGAAAPAPAPRTTVQRNTKRDAAIGAGAGAIIGATTSRNKVKGGVVGAVVGGVLGGVIGNNVDVKKKKTP